MSKHQDIINFFAEFGTNLTLAIISDLQAHKSIKHTRIWPTQNSQEIFEEIYVMDLQAILKIYLFPNVF